MLQPVDIAVAFHAAMTDHRSGAWSQASIRRHLGIPRATLSKSLGRLRHARIIRESFINRRILAALLPLLPNLVPARPLGDKQVQGLVTGFAAPAFGGHFRYAVPQVWELAGGPDFGVPIEPLHDRLPARLAASGDPERHALLAYLDAVRGGRAREVAHGIHGVRLLCGLPAAPGVASQEPVAKLMAGLVDDLAPAAAC